MTDKAAVITSNKRRAIESRLVGHVADLLEVVAFSHSDGTRAFWKCRCACGTELVRSSAHMNKNRARGRKNGCDTCVPSRRITSFVGRTRMTAEERAAARAESWKKYELKKRGDRCARQRRKSWYEPSDHAEKIVDGAVIVSGKVVGQAFTAKERAWFDWAFGE